MTDTERKSTNKRDKLIGAGAAAAGTGTLGVTAHKIYGVAKNTRAEDIASTGVKNKINNYLRNQYANQLAEETNWARREGMLRLGGDKVKPHTSMYIYDLRDAPLSLSYPEAKRGYRYIAELVGADDPDAWNKNLETTRNMITGHARRKIYDSPKIIKSPENEEHIRRMLSYAKEAPTPKLMEALKNRELKPGSMKSHVIGAMAKHPYRYGGAALGGVALLGAGAYMLARKGNEHSTMGKKAGVEDAPDTERKSYIRMNRIANSSNVRSVGYSKRNGELAVRFKSGPHRYIYSDVPQVVYTEMLNSPSKGKYVHQHIKGYYPYRKEYYTGEDYTWEAEMPSKSQAQQRYFGWLYSKAKSGDTSGLKEKDKKVLETMDKDQLREYAATKRTGLPVIMQKAAAESAETATPAKVPPKHKVNFAMRGMRGTIGMGDLKGNTDAERTAARERINDNLIRGWRIKNTNQNKPEGFDNFSRFGKVKNRLYIAEPGKSYVLQSSNHGRRNQRLIARKAIMAANEPGFNKEDDARMEKAVGNYNAAKKRAPYVTAAGSLASGLLTGAGTYLASGRLKGAIPLAIGTGAMGALLGGSITSGVQRGKRRSNYFKDIPDSHAGAISGLGSAAAKTISQDPRFADRLTGRNTYIIPM